ncbi:MAG TPA: hypothetical protein VNX68_08510 [Nitrosopumilaceae archaeon]|jgi:hypothetical protein|nr:hypothetical protein [Nitrosopumilaceae archaeon]
MFYRLQEVVTIASAVFLGMTASTVMRMHAFTGHDNPYKHLCWSMMGVLLVVVSFDLYGYWRARREIKFWEATQGEQGSCCQKEKKHGK